MTFPKIATNVVNTSTRIALFEKFRPSPPKGLVKRVIAYLNERLTTPFDTAVDVGCGSGRSTEVLGPHFKNVIGIDVADIKENYAERKGQYYNIIYRNGTPNEIGCFDSSVQLVTASQCAHWFNLLKFYAETERVLAPGGVLAIYGYTLPVAMQSNCDVTSIIEKFMIKDLEEYMPWQSKKLYSDKYKVEELSTFLFNKEHIVRDESFYAEQDGTVMDLVNYIKSTSTVQNFLHGNGEQATNILLDNLENELMDAVKSNKKPEETQLKILFNFILLLGRKPFTNH